LLSKINIEYLLYLDFLIFFFLLIYFIFDDLHFKQKEQKKNELLQYQDIIYKDLEIEDLEVIEHDLAILEEQLQNQINLNDDLQDYITKWCHEIKIPLSASFLMIEKIDNQRTKKSLKEQLEKIKQQLNNVLLGCKIQGNIYDFVIAPVNLKECVITSLHNNQFFLIHHHFHIDIQLDEVNVYSDKEWLIYVLDQLLNNAIKYRSSAPKLMIWSEKYSDCMKLVIEDNGEGIKEQDIKRVFEKGFTGSNHHNGHYKSTGMGLYIVKVILEKLEHNIEIESEYGCYTRISLYFKDNRDYFNLT